MPAAIIPACAPSILPRCAAAAICGARTTGATVGSRDLSFEPGVVRPGRYEVDVGTAGSTMLVLQTILPALSLCSAPSEILLHGGTHNPRAPTVEFVRDSYLPLLERLGFKPQIALQRHGFFPRGGGAVRASIEPVGRGCALDLIERGALRARSATVLLSGLPEHIAEREIGTRGVPAERVAGDVAVEVQRYLAANVAVDAHLADQLLLPLALAAGGSFSSLRPTAHTQTNAAVIRRFLPIDYQTSVLGPEQWSIAVRSRGSASRCAR